MHNDRIDAALALLAPHLLSPQDPLYFRAVLEELHDGAQDDLLASLRGAHDAAQAWGVTPRRAQAHIARLHDTCGIGRLIGGAWVLRQSDIERHQPDAKYRRKDTTMDFQTISHAIDEIDAFVASSPRDAETVASQFERARNLMAVLDARAETVSDAQSSLFAMRAVRLSALITALQARLQVLDAGDLDETEH